MQAEYMKAPQAHEVAPHAPDAWIGETKHKPHDHKIGIVVYDLLLSRHFDQYVPPRSLREIDRDLKARTDRISQMIEEFSA